MGMSKRILCTIAMLAMTGSVSLGQSGGQSGGQSSVPTAASLTVIRAGTLIDGVSEAPRKNQLIFVRGERIEKVVDGIKTIPQYVDGKTFLMMLITGFIAQMADGSLGMGYGTISTTFLLAMGVNPAIVSSRVHSARVFSSGVSGYSHHRFGNINKKLFRTLIIPGIIGAIAGASLAFYGQKYSTWVRIPTEPIA